MTPKLNTEVATAFPVEQAVKELEPGVYAMTAAPKEQIGHDYDARATQWFIVSDLGLTANSTHDGIDVFVHSLASAEPDAQVAVKLIARNNEVLATALTDKDGHVHFAAGLARGEGGLSPAAVVASAKGDYAFLSLKSPAFDLSDRGVAGRAVPVGLDAFVYTERGVYRSGETVHVTSLLRDARGVAATRRAAHTGDGTAGRRRIPPHADRRSGPRRPLLGRAAGFFRHDRHLARRRLHRSQAPGDRRNHLHGRGLCARPHRVRSHHQRQGDFAAEAA